VNQALEEDELGKEENAIDLYSQAVELCIEAVSSADGQFVIISNHIIK